MGKTYRVPNRGIQNHLTVGMPNELTYKPMALYTLFKRDPFDKKWTRIGTHYFSERAAYRVYGDRIREAPLTYSIRPAKPAANTAQAKHGGHFSRPHYNVAKEFVQSTEQILSEFKR